MYFKLLEMQCTFPLIFDSVNNDFLLEKQRHIY